jgi:hypothetical protein
MTTFEGIHEAGTAIRKWLILNEDKAPEHLKEKFSRLIAEPSLVVITVEFVEAVYANEGEFDEEAKDLAAGAAVVCETWGFHGMGADNRGSLIARVLSGGKVAKAKVPAPRADHTPPPAVQEA